MKSDESELHTLENGDQSPTNAGSAEAEADVDWPAAPIRSATDRLGARRAVVQR